MKVKVDILAVREAELLVERLRSAGAVVVDPYPEAIPTLLQDKLLYLSSSIYGNLSPLPLFEFEKGGRRYVLSNRVHAELAELLPDLKVIHVDVREEALYPFAALALVLNDLGLTRLNRKFLNEYVCPEVQQLDQDDVPLAQEIRKVLSKYFKLWRRGTLWKLCGLEPINGERSDIDIDTIAVRIVESNRKLKPSISVDELEIGLRGEDKALLARVARGLRIPGFRAELEELLRRYDL